MWHTVEPVTSEDRMKQMSYVLIFWLLWQDEWQHSVLLTACVAFDYWHQQVGCCSHSAICWQNHAFVASGVSEWLIDLRGYRWKTGLAECGSVIDCQERQDHWQQLIVEPWHSAFSAYALQSCQVADGWPARLSVSCLHSVFDPCDACREMMHHLRSVNGHTQQQCQTTHHHTTRITEGLRLSLQKTTED